MSEVFEYAFMQRAFLAGAGASVLLGALGVFVTSRKMSFIGDGVAHASLAAVALAILFGWAPVPVSLLFALVIGTSLFFLNSRITISQDVAIGIIFTTFLSLGIILLQYHEGYAPELVSYLFGNILSVTALDVIIILVSAVVMLGLLTKFYREFLFLTIDPEGAELVGVSKNIFDLLLYNFIAVAVVLSVKLVGIVLVTGLLILPSAIARPWSASFKDYLITSIFVSIFMVFIGLFNSYWLDWPSGATIILGGAITLIMSHTLKHFFAR